MMWGSTPLYIAMKIKEYLNPEEVRHFTSKSDWLGARVVIITWLSIMALFAVVDTWTNPLTIVLAWVLLAGRQLALAVIVHECGHHTLFKTEALNQFCGQWLAARWVFSDMYSYARDHNHHHQLAGTREDPDLGNYRNYPVSRDSFKRKVIRDLTGQTGYKLLRYVFKSAAGIFSAEAERRAKARPFAEEIAANVTLAIILGVAFQPWFYVLWIGTYMTSYMLVVRIRQVAEHAAVPDLYDLDARNNTRTTIPSWWQKLIFAPNQVNYHMEHHFMASVPCYRLKALHERLTSKGAYMNTRIYQGYGEVLRQAVTA